MSADRLDIAHIDTWVFDLDNTLYPPTEKVFGQIDARMKAFIARELDVGLDEAYAIQKRYFREHGTTLRGLMDRHGTAPESFLEFVHDIDHSVLKPDDALGRALADLPGRKLVFTNATVQHAQKVLMRLGIGAHFEDIFDVRAAGYLPKPNRAAYRAFIEHFMVDPKRAAMFEDSHANLRPAAELGMTTVWVHPDHAATPPRDIDHCDYATEAIVSWLTAARAARRPTP
jgi:putative hydrolase of the HAD superfamily